MHVLLHGGKTTYIAELMQNIGEIEAWDLHKHRINLVNESSKRLGLNIINTKVKDASIFDPNYVEKFGKILLDVPCLGIGVIKRKPDIKWQKQEKDIGEITKIQTKILDTCSKYLKKQGTIIYSTCSIFKEENDKIINEFINKNNDFEIEKINEKNNFLNIYPNDIQDGFFIAKITKRI